MLIFLNNSPKVPCSGEQSLYDDLFWYVFYLCAELSALDSEQVLSLKGTGEH